MFIFQGKLDWEVASDVHVASDETVTIVIPRSTFLGDPVQVFWQWTVVKDAQEKTNAEVYLNGTIDAFLSPTQFRFRDNSESDYRFEATLIDNHATGTAELYLVMSNQAGVTQGPFVLRRPFELKTDVRDFLYPSLPAPRIYLGKLNWWRYARDELFVIVCPSRIEEGSPVCAFWQWTETQDGSKKKSSAVVSPYEDVANGDHGLTFRFQNAGKHYSWTCKINEDTNELDVHMTSQSGGKADCTLRLLDVESGHPLQPDSHAIVNDTDDLVFCGLRSHKTDARGRSPSISTFFPIALQPSTRLTQYDWAMKVITTTIASVGVADVQDASELPTSQILYPGDFVGKKSRGGWLDPHSELTIARLHVNENDSTLKLRLGRVSGVGNETLRLSDLFRDQSSIKMETLSTLSFAPRQYVHTQRLVTSRAFAIPGLKPTPDFPVVDPQPWGDVPDSRFGITKNEDGSVPIFYSLLQWQELPTRDRRLFTFDPSNVFFFSMLGGSASDVEAYQLENGAHVVSLRRCILKPVAGSAEGLGRKLEGVQDHPAVYPVLEKTPGAWAYSWGGAGKAVWAWNPSSPDSLSIEFSESWDNYVYFVIHRLNEVNSHSIVEIGS